jgi:hypothetical protein
MSLGNCRRRLEKAERKHFSMLFTKCCNGQGPRITKDFVRARQEMEVEGKKKKVQELEVGLRTSIV